MWKAQRKLRKERKTFPPPPCGRAQRSDRVECQATARLADRGRGDATIRLRAARRALPALARRACGFARRSRGLARDVRPSLRAQPSSASSSSSPRPSSRSIFVSVTAISLTLKSRATTSSRWIRSSDTDPACAPAYRDARRSFGPDFYGVDNAAGRSARRYSTSYPSRRGIASRPSRSRSIRAPAFCVTSSSIGRSKSSAP